MGWLEIRKTYRWWVGKHLGIVGGKVLNAGVDWEVGDAKGKSKLMQPNRLHELNPMALVHRPQDTRANP
jgi:hypothetical protein